MIWQANGAEGLQMNIGLSTRLKEKVLLYLFADTTIFSVGGSGSAHA